MSIPGSCTQAILLPSEQDRIHGLVISGTDKAQIAKRIEAYIKRNGWVGISMVRLLIWA
ncbi:hypothetical protein [Microvirga lotononidis]|uniref:Uncharacterized protein n=1 Tax=Microvirga lotononidis TaxID=864069 RepID=I4Z2B0_9HYPH|nr:hypothetical protein [Microvirga lotononidis]EIM30352.1 hypothetical protein MicloDRAFT_00009020 [Microvirga lotononidis]WQO30852.1 hypothetical protein U0023_25925 [Microvirga lotononidis]